MTKKQGSGLFISVFLFAFSCFYSKSSNAQNPVSAYDSTQINLPGQFDNDDSLNQVDNDLTDVDSLNVQKYSFANVDVPTFEDSIYLSRLKAIPTSIPLTYNEQVRKYIDLYVLDRRQQVSRLLGLSKFYFPIFDQIFENYGLPVELKNLSIIESALNPHAISRCGAVGLWQFMYGTAKVYGLSMNNYIDERRDIIRSTEGAAQYLKNMYDVYGDWLLAIASYNCGPGSINRAISLAGSNNFWDIVPYLPRETREYVPAFIAATYVMNYYDLHDLEPTYPPYTFDSITTVPVDAYMSCDAIAKFTGLSVDQFRFLNPGFRCNVIPGNGDVMYSCSLPSDKASFFTSYHDSIIFLSKNIKPTYYDNYVLGGRIVYTVRRGDNLGKIAARYHVSTAQIRGWNGLKSSTIHHGQKLRIYGASYAYSNKTYHYGTHSKHSATASSKSNISQNVIYYKTRTGDTLWDIAQRHGTTVAKLRELNGTKANNLKAGTVLKISSKG